MQSSPAILLAVICGFFLILGGMVAFAVFFIRRETATKAKIAAALGLSVPRRKHTGIAGKSRLR